MNTQQPVKLRVTPLFLGATALVELAMLFSSVHTVFTPEREPLMIIELVFLLLMLAGAGMTLKAGSWLNKQSRLVAYGLFGVYALWSLLHFSYFASKLAACFAPQYGHYYGMALQTAKLIVLFIGIAAPARTVALPDRDAYVAALDAVSRNQQLEWAAAAAKGADKDAQRTIENLKAQLGEAEFERLLGELEQRAAAHTANDKAE